jgi:hypothetical protein
MLRYLTLVAIIGCKPASGDVVVGGAGGEDEDDAVTPSSTLSAPQVVYGVPNADDDDANGKVDWRDRVAPDDELAPLVIDATGFYELQLNLDGSDIRVWHEDSIIVGPDEPKGSVPALGMVTLWVEFGEFLAKGTLSLTAVPATGDNQSTDVHLESSPLILNHHLQPAEHVYAVSVKGWGDNQAFIEGYETALGASFTAVKGGKYGGDVWIQDEVEFGIASAPGQRLDIVIDSIRDRGLDDFAEDYFDGPGASTRTWGKGWATSQDSFGNLEVSPPVNVNGLDYPYGRIYYGVSGNDRPHDRLTSVLSDQSLQAPFEVDIGWLCVGHVDEFTSFVPDSTAPKGYRFLYADTNTAWDFLATLDPKMEIPKYSGSWNGHGVDTIGDILEDEGLREYNDKLQAERLDPMYEVFKAQLGLTDDDVILVPSLFEVACGVDYAAAMIPGMVNLTVVNIAGETTKVFMADPFLRTDIEDQSTDLLIADMRARLPAELELHFLDDWDTYHMGLGEVHCGSNIVRTPSETTWWEASP